MIFNYLLFCKFADCMKRKNKKHKVIERIYKICKQKRNYKFNNDLVKEISKKIGFGNPFDATKIDAKEKLPEILLKEDRAIIHLGEGNHKFIKGIDKIYHDFEPIKKTIEWKYKKSVLNQFNSSESNILSVANNQRILHHFLFEKDTELNDIDISKRPKTYFPHRTKTSFDYYFGTTKLSLKNIQIEIDLTIEFQGKIGVFEAKNGTPTSFSIYQIYHPFLYYYEANQKKELNGKVKNIYGIYVVRAKTKTGDLLKLWAYTFLKPYDITSLKLIKSKQYKLISK